MSVDQEYAREQLALDLAIKLHAGTATAEEMQEAADLLSYAIGERLRLERQLERQLERRRNVVTALSMAYDLICVDLCQFCEAGNCYRHDSAGAIVVSVEQS